MRSGLARALFILGALSCSPAPLAGDAGPADSGHADAGAADAGRPDAGAPDAGTPDAGSPDGGSPDAGITDGGAPDAGSPDSGAPDSGTADAGACEGGFLNSTAPNACPLSCSPAVEPVPDEGAIHVPMGTPVVYLHNPPASGPHWPAPAPWGVHGEIVPREWWVHNLEHGGIVLLYNCPWPADAGVDGGEDGGPPVPNACEPDIATLAAFYANGPVDNWYDQFSETRILVTPDELLPTRFAAVAWDWSFTFDAIDTAAVQCFIDARYGRGPEMAP
jgi:hypothetical protein